MRIKTRTDKRRKTFPIRKPMVYMARVSGHGRRLYWFHHLSKVRINLSTNIIRHNHLTSDQAHLVTIKET